MRCEPDMWGLLCRSDQPGNSGGTLDTLQSTSPGYRGTDVPVGVGHTPTMRRCRVFLAAVSLCGSISVAQSASATVPDDSVTTPSTSPRDYTEWATNPYFASWVERLKALELAPVFLIEECVAASALTGLPAERLAAAEVLPASVAAGETLAHLDATNDEILLMASELRTCELGRAYATLMHATMSRFVSIEDAECVGAAIALDLGYSIELAQWLVGDIAGDWIDAIDERHLNDALIQCPDAFATMTVGGLSLQLGDLPPEAVACLEIGFRREVAEILSGVDERALPAVDRVMLACVDELGPLADEVFAD